MKSLYVFVISMSYVEGPRDARITPDDRGAHMVICAFYTGTVAVMAVLARFWIKCYQKKKLGWDDYIILCALVQTFQLKQSDYYSSFTDLWMGSDCGRLSASRRRHRQRAASCLKRGLKTHSAGKSIVEILLICLLANSE